jgi:hypothetical protein
MCRVFSTRKHENAHLRISIFQMYALKFRPNAERSKNRCCLIWHLQYIDSKVYAFLCVKKSLCYDRDTLGYGHTEKRAKERAWTHVFLCRWRYWLERVVSAWATSLGGRICSLSWANPLDLHVMVAPMRMRGAVKNHKARRCSYRKALQPVNNVAVFGVVMTKYKEIMMSEVHARHALWRKDHANFRRKNITDKLWEVLAGTCNMTNGKLFQKIKTNGMLFIYSLQFVTEITVSC